LARISIIGSGYVGMVTGSNFLNFGNQVIFHDIDEEKIEQLLQKKLDATTDIFHAVMNSDISFLSVPTPTKNGKIDLNHIADASKNIAKVLKDKQSHHTLVVKSTVVPGTTRNRLIPILEHHSKKVIDEDFAVCVNPEFSTEIEKTWTDDEKYKIGFENEPRIVIGETEKNSFAGNLLSEFYRPLNKPIFRVSLEEAEAIKYLSNCFLAMRISYWNEIFLVLKDFGIDTRKLAPIVGLDYRIGKYGTVHGKAFGGKCLPKDLAAFIDWLEKSGKKSKILKAVQEINDNMRKKYGIRE